MAAINNLVSWSAVAAAIIAYAVGLLLYRLTLHPLARFPGPKWTAITRFYEGYFDVVQDGQYTFKIAELHKKHGPIIRISPYEVHVNDPDFFDTLYRQDARYDKYDWAFDAFAVKGATLFTIAHDVHKARRQPINPYFSKAKVASRQDMIHRHLSKLHDRLSGLADKDVSFNLGAAITALARDVSNDFVLGKSYNSLDQEDFDVAMLEMSQGGGVIWRLSKFVRFVGPVMQGLPIPMILKMADGPVKIFFRHLLETQDYIKMLMAEATSTTNDSKGSRTVVHEILDSKLDPSEKVFKRVYQDASTMTGAGFETTASVLRLIVFHIWSSPMILQRLRNELREANATQSHPLELQKLEQLPYLTAVLTEGLRLSPAIATRMARVSPTADIYYDNWRIPAGTAVGMTLILMHMDEKLYPQPRQFNPDRWMTGTVLKKAEKGFAPFGKGSRNCIGMHLAWAEMYTTVADLVQYFDFQFQGARAEDFECISDQFAIGTSGLGHLKATVTRH